MRPATRPDRPPAGGQAAARGSESGPESGPGGFPVRDRPPDGLLEEPLPALPGIGPARRQRLAALGLRTVADVLHHLPRRYEDRRPTALAAGRQVAFDGVVRAVRASRPRPGVHLLRALVAGDAGEIEAVWFNRAYLARRIRPGHALHLWGRLEARAGRLRLVSPEVEVGRGDAAAGGPGAGYDAHGIVPVYPLTAGLPQRLLRSTVAAVVRACTPALPEALPEDLRRRCGLIEAARAWHDVHLPPDFEALAAARRRLAFDELLLLQLGVGLRRRRRAGVRRPVRYAPPADLTAAYRGWLPYDLTAAQARVLAEIEADLGRPRPAYRLLQGDVGSGKTVVATLALLRAVESGLQGALMAPTEILAEQHWERISRELAPAGVRTVLVTGSQGRAERADALAALGSGQAAVAVGTHALLQPEVAFRQLGLVVTDEQHRFGVRQRDLLAAKGTGTDVLVMTATPIPRTLALTLYGDLDVSVLDELPPGRRPVRTFCRPTGARGRVYRFVGDQIRAGRQAYVVCPTIGEAGEGEPDAAPAVPGAPAGGARTAGKGRSGAAAPDEAAVTAWADRLRRFLPQARVEALHGRLPAAAKEGVMRRFAAGGIDLLVATTVVEVGVDVANASVMVVEGADRFGLAQLHQLRGRVGRGPHPSYCVLIADPASEDGRERLQTMVATTDGFAIAEADLRLRGAGDLLGTRQHGLPPLRIADLGSTSDLRLLEMAHREAEALLARNPDLATVPALRAAVETLFAQDVSGWEG